MTNLLAAHRGLHQRRQFAQAARLEVLVAPEPQNLQHKTKLELGVREQQRAAPAAAPRRVRPLGEIEPPAAAPPVAARRPRRPRAAGAGPVAPPSPPRHRALAADEEEFVDEHLAEGRVFRKYGLVDKAARPVRGRGRALPGQPRRAAGAADVYKEKGQGPQAAVQCLPGRDLPAARATRPRPRAGSRGRARLRPAAGQAAPAARAGRPAAAPAPAPPEPRPRRRPREAPAPARRSAARWRTRREIHLGVEEGRGRPVLDTDDGAVRPRSRSRPRRRAPAAAPARATRTSTSASTSESERSSAQFIEDEAPGRAARFARESRRRRRWPTYELVLEESPRRAAPVAGRAQVPADWTGLDEIDSYVVDRASSGREGRRWPRAGDGAPPGRAALDEVDPTSRSGSGIDAKEALREIRHRCRRTTPRLAPSVRPAPTSPHRRARAAWPALGRADLDAGSRRPVRSDRSRARRPRRRRWRPDDRRRLGFELRVAGRGGDGGIDLGDELNDLFGAQAAVEEAAAEPAATDLGDTGLADIFKEFKKGVDKQLGKEDYDTRYNLGIAYKEMGLIDEAIAEFQLAAKDENRMLECSSMLGHLLHGEGHAEARGEVVRQGAEGAGPHRGGVPGLRYDLATAHEARGRPTRRSTCSPTSTARTPFRDVAAR